MLIEIIAPNFKYSDERGLLVQLVREGYSQVNVVHSVAGSSRGGHYHKLNRETFYIVNGRLHVTVYLGNISESYKFTAGDMFTILPNVAHEFTCLDDTTLIGLYDKGVELIDGKMDIFSWGGTRNGD